VSAVFVFIVILAVIGLGFYGLRGKTGWLRIQAGVWGLITFSIEIGQRRELPDRADSGRNSHLANSFITPANIGYMSGALKHFFDGIYYPCLEATRRRPYGLYVHGASDTGGVVRAVESIATGLQWRKVRPPACVTGAPSRPDLEACWELGALLAAEIAG
jgi:hypothetical protein